MGQWGVRPTFNGQALRQRALEFIEADSSIPTFANSTSKLNLMLNDPDADFRKLAGVVESDPTLAAACIRLASSAAYGRSRIDSVVSAMSRIGTKEIRRLTSIRGVLDAFRHFKVDINWTVFMSHALLVARITEHLYRGYSRVPMVEGGPQHLAGLIHDIGRVFIAHHFPQEFETMAMRSMERRIGVFDMEVKILGISHAEIGGAMCKKWNLNPDITHAVRYHHEPASISMMKRTAGESGHVLSVCLCAANAMANCYAEAFVGSVVTHATHETLPEWTILSTLEVVREVEFDITNEIAAVGDVVASLLA